MANQKIKASEEVREALFEIQVDAFLRGLADDVPSMTQFGLSRDRAKEILGWQRSRAVLLMQVKL